MNILGHLCTYRGNAVNSINIRLRHLAAIFEAESTFKFLFRYVFNFFSIHSGIPMIHQNGDEKNQNNEHVNSPKRIPGGSFEQGNDNSIVVSIELNGIKYQGVLYAQHR